MAENLVNVFNAVSTCEQNITCKDNYYLHDFYAYNSSNHIVLINNELIDSAPHILNDIIPYFSNANIEYFNKKFIHKIPELTLRQIAMHDNYKTQTRLLITKTPTFIPIHIFEITNWEHILYKCRRVYLDNVELNYVLQLIRDASVYTPTMINILLEFCFNDLDLSENYENIIFELLELCCQNISCFSIINDIKPTSMTIPDPYDDYKEDDDQKYADKEGDDDKFCYEVNSKEANIICRAIEIIITFTGESMNESVVKHLEACGIRILEPGRFYSSN